MSQSTRDRLIQAASRLFASHGFHGAPVRDICNVARANPGAVSYHFGGKRQLYRTVLRHAVQRLASAATPDGQEAATPPTDVGEVVRRVFRRVGQDPEAVRLLVRDLADGGTVAVEALEPTLRAAVDGLSRLAGYSDLERRSTQIRSMFLELAAPVFLLSVAWPVLARPLELTDSDRDRLLENLVTRVRPRALPTSQPSRERD
jgi:AcrR family transcriptional regulator